MTLKGFTNPIQICSRWQLKRLSLRVCLCFLWVTTGMNYRWHQSADSVCYSEIQQNGNLEMSLESTQTFLQSLSVCLSIYILYLFYTLRKMTFYYFFTKEKLSGSPHFSRLP